jgi:hypothetical protein
MSSLRKAALLPDMDPRLQRSFVPAPSPEKGDIPACIICVLDERGLAPIFGVPVVRRLVLLAKRAGLSPLYLLGRIELVREAICDLLHPESLLPAHNILELAAAVEGLKMPDQAKVLLMRAHQLIDQSLSDLVAAPLAPGQLVREGEGEEAGGSFYLARRDGLLPLLSALWADPGSMRSPLPGTVRVKGFFGMPCAVGASTEERKACEAALIAACASRVKEDDSFLSRHVNRRISRFTSERIVRTGMTANHVTLINGVIGLAGAFLLHRLDTGSGLWVPCSFFFVSSWMGRTEK